MGNPINYTDPTGEWNRPWWDNDEVRKWEQRRNISQNLSLNRPVYWDGIYVGNENQMSWGALTDASSAARGPIYISLTGFHSFGRGSIRFSSTQMNVYSEWGTVTAPGSGGLVETHLFSKIGTITVQSAEPVHKVDELKTILGAGGLSFGAGELSLYNSLSWWCKNGKIYELAHGANQWTGSRLAAKSLSIPWKLAGRGLFFVSTAISLYSMGDYYSSGGKGSFMAEKTMVDILMVRLPPGAARWDGFWEGAIS